MPESIAIHDTVLGTLKHVPAPFNEWKGRIAILGKEIDVALCPEASDLPADEFVRFGREVVPFVERNDLELRSAIVNRLLRYYNEEQKWPTEEPDLTSDEFLQVTELAGIRIGIDQYKLDYNVMKARLSYTCDLFGDRSPIIILNSSLEIDDIFLE